jgi:NADH:ubiquinone oxidoreductase subunit B-like Fe-S oxidoreductase
MGGIDQVLPVNAYIPGCPPRPEAIIDGMVKLLTAMKEGTLPELDGSAPLDLTTLPGSDSSDNSNNGEEAA